MKRKISVLCLLLAIAFVVLPLEASASSEQPGKNKSYKSKGWKNGSWEGKRGRRRYQGRNRYHPGYRNYGQYRRTQVGNRRSRLVRRYYWRDGTRLSRWVRVFY